MSALRPIRSAPEISDFVDVLPRLMAHDFLFHGSHFGGPREEYLHSGDVRHSFGDVSRRVGAAQDGRNRPARRVVNVAPDTLNEFRHLTPHIPKAGGGITARAATSSWRGTIAQNSHSRALTRANAPASAQSPPDPTLAGAPHNPARGSVGTAERSRSAFYSRGCA